MKKTAIQDLFAEIKSTHNPGKIATYIPELAKVAPHQFGMYYQPVSGTGFGLGDHKQPFSIQSIAKVFSLTLAMQLEGEALWQRVDVEPSGNPFNSLIQLETEHGIPRNPLINAGALVVCDVLMSHLSSPQADLLQFIRDVTGLPQLSFTETIAHSEDETGYRNRALINLMRDFDNIKNPVEEVLDLYFHLCSINMTCQELAQGFQYLACHGRRSLGGETLITTSQAKRINAIMQLCGFYDEAGDIAYRVGLPGKSGVGGGIIALRPDQYTIALWSPPLNPKGNSYYGMKFLEEFTTLTGTSIF
ncbi:MAG TPA: glutaminase [Cytophagales bacterium]|nr:glutaminase [Cytophagales bacterium]